MKCPVFSAIARVSLLVNTNLPSRPKRTNNLNSKSLIDNKKLISRLLRLVSQSANSVTFTLDIREIGPISPLLKSLSSVFAETP